MEEHNDIITEFLDVIDVCSWKKAKHYDLDACKACKFNHERLYMYKSLPPDIAKQLDIFVNMQKVIHARNAKIFLIL